MRGGREPARAPRWVAGGGRGGGCGARALRGLRAPRSGRAGGTPPPSRSRARPTRARASAKAPDPGDPARRAPPPPRPAPSRAVFACRARASSRRPPSPKTAAATASGARRTRPTRTSAADNAQAVVCFSLPSALFSLAASPSDLSRSCAGPRSPSRARGRVPWIRGRGCQRPGRLLRPEGADASAATSATAEPPRREPNPYPNYTPTRAAPLIDSDFFRHLLHNMAQFYASHKLVFVLGTAQHDPRTSIVGRRPQTRPRTSTSASAPHRPSRHRRQPRARERAGGEQGPVPGDPRSSY